MTAVLSTASHCFRRSADLNGKFENRERRRPSRGRQECSRAWGRNLSECAAARSPPETVEGTTAQGKRSRLLEESRCQCGSRAGYQNAVHSRWMTVAPSRRFELDLKATRCAVVCWSSRAKIPAPLTLLPCLSDRERRSAAHTVSRPARKLAQDQKITHSSHTTTSHKTH